MIAGAQKAIAAAVAPLLKRIETLEAISPLQGERGEPGPQGEPGRDGVGLAGAMVDRDGVLILTLSNGTHTPLGVVVGTNGADGAKGEPGKDGTDGANGNDGRDGFSLDDFDIMPGDDGRTITLKFQQGETRHAYELVFPVAIYRGVFKDGTDYTTGDLVTWAGSMWHCDEATKAKPGDGPWTLATKKGRDGRDGKPA